MKRLFYLLLLSSSVFASEQEDKFEKLWPAICKVESNNNCLAVGDSGRAAGIAQIHPGCLQDSNEYGGTKFTLNDRFDPNKSKIICFNYLKRYQKFHKWELDKMARLWNGGLRGPERKATFKYWEKIQIVLDSN